MFNLLILLLVAAVVVEGRDQTIIHGWVAEPDGRGTWSLLWSCLATIFICTWSVLHLKVPKSHGTWYLLFRKIKWMLFTAMAPEYMLYKASTDYLEARFLLKFLRRDSSQEWTLTHARFAHSKGFFTRTSQQLQENHCSPAVLWDLARNDRIIGPLISEKELESRGKTDGVVKLVAVLQITWFGLQTLVRAIQHYQITALEIMTTAFVFCSLFIYGFCWNQPQDVEYPVFIEILDSPVQELTPLKTNAREQPLFAEHADPEAQHLQDKKWDADTVKEAEKAWKAATKEERDNRLSGVLPGFLLLLFGCGFGAIHCLAWNSPFPTSAEKHAWHVCAVAMTCLPLVAIIWHTLRFCFVILKMSPIFVFIYSEPLLWLIYISGRITIIVLALIALRALPADTYQTVNWNNYLPHFAA